LVWRYDRFARSTRALVNALGEFRARGVAFISYQENVVTTTPQGELVFGMMANLAQFESALIGERVKAGMARAKAQGKRTSRPPIPEATRRRITKLHAQGVSIKRIAKELGIAYGTAWNYVRGRGAIRLRDGKGLPRRLARTSPTANRRSGDGPAPVRPG
jgi:DNA invertase Pin-like site-specific DNA recombinase